MKKELLFTFSALIATTSCNIKKTDSEQIAGKKPMNIIYIMSDDHSYQTISAYDKRFIQTPNIDRLANEGVRFTNSFVANSISGPSRACILTGKHSHANGFTDNSSTFDGSQQTYPKLLQKAGYETAIIGKWHLTSAPTGFDYSEILIGQGIYYNAPFIKNGKQVPSKGYVTNVITEKAIDWMENIHDKNKPFCLLLHHKAPHRTWMPDTCDLQLFSDTTFELPANFYDDYNGRQAAHEQKMSIIKDMDLVYDLKMADKENEIHTTTGLENAGRSMYNSMTPEEKAAWDAHYDPIIQKFKKDKLSGKQLSEWKYQQYMRDYLATILAVDENIGRLLNYLEKIGELDNTIIVYTSDQGFFLGEHGWFDKRFMYEECQRMPLIIRYPKAIKAGSTSNAISMNVDFAPTFLDFAGVDIPSDIQGASLKPILVNEGKTPADWRKAAYYHYYEYPAEHSVKRHYGIRTQDFKLIHFYNDIDEWEMYNMKADPREMNNVFGKPEYAKVQKELMELLQDTQKQYKDTDPDEKEKVLFKGDRRQMQNR